MRQDNTYLASVVFHELAHQRLYVDDDSAFNEAFAVAVETSGVRNGSAPPATRPDCAATKLIASARRFSRAGGEDARRAGAGLWQPRTPEQMAAAKAAAIDRLRVRYRRMRDRRWGGYRGYDAWFAAPINNAKLAATSVYGEQVRRSFACSTCARATIQVLRVRPADRGFAKSSRAEALKTADTCG